MGGEGAEAILQRVEKTTDVLALQNVLPDNIEALSQTLEDLQSLVATFRVRRVLELSGPQLMQAGVDLYNAPRAALKALIEAEKTKKQEDEQIKAYPRYLLALTRFVAANIMDLSLLCSKDSGQDADMKRNSLYLDECIDVLRSFGRVGMLMLESASADCGRCEEYLTLAKEAFSSSLQLWSGIGLAYLTKFKQGFELEEVVDDLWDFCTDRVRVLQLLMESSSNALEKFQDIVASLHELQMLAPYKNSYGKNLLDLMASLSEEFCRLNQHELQSPLVEQAMRVCDSLETNGDESLTRLVDAFKQRVLTNLLQSLCATADIDRAEACYQLIPANREPKLLLLMINLYVGTNNFEKAQQLLLLLFQQDNLEDSIAGARSYAQGLAFSEEGLEIYRHLLYNYGDSSFEINLDIACNLALDESKRYQAMDEIKHLEEVILESERNGQAVDNKHIKRLRQTIFDALQHALNANQHQDCLKWAELGLGAASTDQEKAMYMRSMSRSCTQLGNIEKALDWAEKAFDTENSKKCLFTLFQVRLETKAGETDDKLADIVKQLQARDDFEMQDLLAFGKVASSFGPGRHDIVRIILDELCDALMQTEKCPANIPKGIILQNAAQLAFNKHTHQQGETDSEPDKSYGDEFLAYASALLQLSMPTSTDDRGRIGPSSVFEWFYSICFEIAKSTEESRFFIMAADLAERSIELFQDESRLKQCCQQCLLAAVSTDMKNIETLDKDQLRHLLEVISRYEAIAAAEDDDDVRYFLAKSVVATKLRLFDANTAEIFEFCKVKLQKNVSDFMEIGELVLYATKFKESFEVRDKYRSLARQLFNYSLQLLFQAETIDSGKMCYVLRRLITLAESKTSALEWFQQLLQIFDSLDATYSELDMEWFVSQCWNTGVLCHRNDDTDGAQHFMKIALAVLEKCEPLMAKLGHDLHQQYQLLLRAASKPKLDG